MKKQSFGTWLTIYSEAVAEILATAGYDWITVDLEHSPISLSQAEKLVRVIDLAGAKPYVCLLYTSPSPRDVRSSRMPSSA